MIEPAGSAEKSTYIVDSKRRVSIGQAWIRTWTKSKLDARLVNLQQRGRKAMLFSLVRIGGACLCNT